VSFVPENKSLVNPDPDFTDIFMSVSSESLLFKPASVVFLRKLPSRPEPFQKLPARVIFFRVFTTKPHDYRFLSKMIRIRSWIVSILSDSSFPVPVRGGANKSGMFAAFYTEICFVSIV
jgi:hypothetical protein